MKYGFGRHRLVQTHESSGRTNLYIAAHAMLVEKPSSEEPKIGSPGEVLPYEESQRIIGDIWNWCQRPEFVLSVEWENEGQYGRDAPNGCRHDRNSTRAISAWAYRES
jgi:alpha-ketoglutarate-dependent 2,4-dichlorophenoxyacetate dioxygenase